MGNSIIVACPLCGALGKAGEPCEFCGATIPQPSGNAKTTIKAASIIVEKQTVPAEEFASKISKYHRVEPWKHDLAVVAIGGLHGAINRNGDIVIPLNYNQIILSERYCLLDKDLYDKTNGALIKNVLHDDYYSRCESIRVSDGIGAQIVIEAIYDKKFNVEKYRWEYKISVEYFDIESKKTIYHNSESEYCDKEVIIEMQSQRFHSKNIAQYNAYEWRCRLLISRFTGKTINARFIKADGSARIINEFWSGEKTEKFEHAVQIKDVEDPVSYLSDLKQQFFEEDKLLAKNRAVTKNEKNNKQNLGCVVLLLPLLAFGAGATFGVIEIIKLVLL